MKFYNMRYLLFMLLFACVPNKKTGKNKEYKNIYDGRYEIIHGDGCDSIAWKEYYYPDGDTTKIYPYPDSNKTKTTKY